MAYQISSKGKVTVALIIIAIVLVALYQFKVIPHSIFTSAQKPDAIITANNWVGYLGLLAANGGLEPDTNSIFYQKFGILVKIIWQDNPQAAHDAWKAGEVDGLWQTLDAFTTEVSGLMEFKPIIPLIVDRSNGGDLCIARPGINSVDDLVKRKEDGSLNKVALAVNAPSHTLFLRMMQAGGKQPSEVELVGKTDAIAAKQDFLNGNVDAAVIWSPDDEECIKAVPGSKVIFSTEKATNIIYDIFLFKKSFAEKKEKVLKAFVEGVLYGNALVNTDPLAKERAIQIMSVCFNTDINFIKAVADKARRSTYGDNVNFFLNPNFKGMTGERLYRESGLLFAQVGAAPATLPDWKQIVWTKTLQSITDLTGPQQMAEAAPAFTPITKEIASAPAIAIKKVTVNFAINSALLTAEARGIIDREFVTIARANAAYRIRVEGNTDNTGSDKINIPLSYRRAQSVVNHLIETYNFDPRRFVVVGNGSTNPLPGNKNATPEERLANRRTEFQLLPQ